MKRGLGYRFDLEDRPWLRAHQLAFRGSAFETLSVPAEVDPRSYMSLRDQQQLGSCSGASRTACEERLNQLATKTTAKLLLSMMFAYLTNQKCCGCFGADNGATIAGSVQAAGQYGICHETLLPYTGQYVTDIPDAATTEGAAHLIQSHTVISDYDTAIQYLGTAGVIQIGIPVGNAFQSCQGPLTLRAVRQDANNPQGGHALAVIGYVNAETVGAPASDARRWLIGQNSWGMQWGAGGFFFIEPAAWDFFCQQTQNSGGQGGGQVELIGMSHLQSFDNPDAAIDWSQCYA
jgi:C1A family cysteine protease